MAPVAEDQKKDMEQEKKDPEAGHAAADKVAAQLGSMGLDVAPPAAPGAQPSVAEVTREKDRQQQSVELLEAMYGKGFAEKQKEHKFWDTQPVPKKHQDTSTVEECGPLENKTVNEVRKEPYTLPKGFEWSTLDVLDEKQLAEVYTLLNENYVEDDDNMFRFDYSREFLRWAVTSPGYFKEWHVGIRNSKNNQLLAMITGIPAHVVARGTQVKMAEINFLCIHKKLRSKRLAPVLIKEVTRRVNLEDQWSAVYTAGVHLPKPIGRCRYYHRSLNPKKLVDVGFSSLGPRMTMARLIRLNKLNGSTSTPGLRAMEKRDVDQVYELLKAYLKQFRAWIYFDKVEIAHWFLPRDNVIYSYVVEDPKSPGVITDFLSFYNLPSTIIGHPRHNHLKAAYSFYNVAHTRPLTDLMRDALIMANKEQFDVFNCLDLMENQQFLEALRFGRGDGNLHYYFYNYVIPECAPGEIGIVLL